MPSFFFILLPFAMAWCNSQVIELQLMVLLRENHPLVEHTSVNVITKCAQIITPKTRQELNLCINRKGLALFVWS